MPNAGTASYTIVTFEVAHITCPMATIEYEEICVDGNIPGEYRKACNDNN